MYFYQAFGMCIVSDLEMKELLPGNAASGPAELLIRAGEVPDLNADESAASSFQGDQDRLLLDIKSVARFLILNGQEIIYSCHAGVDEDTLRLFILGSCMGAVLQQRGHIVLHGNAISSDGKTCTIFVGHTGAGKSTLAARYFQQGASILADDVCAIYFNPQGVPYVLPSYPQIKLWQDSADLLGIPTAGLRPIRPQDLKFAYRIDKQFCQQALPLRCIVEIAADSNGEKSNGIEKLKQLINHSYRYYFLQHMHLSNQYAKLLLQLINQVELIGMDRNNAVTAC